MKIYELEAKERSIFLVKVYGIVNLQLIITILIICLNMFVPQLVKFNFRYWWLPLPFFGAALMMTCFLICFQEIFPINIILMTIFTLSFAWGVGIVSSFYSLYSIIVAFSIIFFLNIFISIAVYIFKVDFSRSIVLLIVSMGLSMTLFIMLPLSFVFIFVFHQYWLNILIILIILSLFIILLALDTSRIAFHYSHEQYLEASMNLYLDMMLIFLYILPFTPNRG